MFLQGTLGQNVQIPLDSILDIFENGKIIREITHTNICMISKVIPPNDVIDFRLTSYRNFIYKLLAKVLCNKKKMVLTHLISKN